jgi:hypothetical protein
MNGASKPAQANPPPLTRKAGLRQVIATLFWGLLMIGKKDTWERNGAIVTLPQVIIGTLIMTVVVIGILILLVKLALS